jgi:hypothetical protein
MASASSNGLVTFTLDTRVALLRHLHENPNNRRVSPNDKELLIEWLTNPHRRPSSQEEFSRRNYVRRTFAWDEKSQTMLAYGKSDGGKDRTVITTDKIADVVETVHNENDHAGWDATWKDVSTSYYGILRSDVIFLLKQCQICAQNPSKRPKGSEATTLHFPQTDHEFVELRNMGDVQYDDSTLNAPEDDKHQGE